MRTKAARRERAEKRPSQVGAPGEDEDGSGDISETETDLATLAAVEGLFRARSLRSREHEARSQLRTHRRSEEGIGVARARQCFIEMKSPRDRPTHASREVSGAGDDERDVATKDSHP
jgi:hypothetical protein